MRTLFTRPIVFYPLAILFIGVWWALTLRPQFSVQESRLKSEGSLSVNQLPVPYLRPIGREELHGALLGDCKRMIDLIAEWDTEAQLLQAQQIAGVQRLSSNRYLRAQMLGRQVMARQRGLLDRSTVPYGDVDDLGVFLSLTRFPERLLPQTELAASILLALAEPQQIVALPRRLRNQTLFPKMLLDQIGLDIDRYNGELLFAASPDIAFVAHYTQPSVLETLRNQGIALFTLTRMGSLEEIQQTIQKIGRAIGRAEQAELLSIFMDAGFAALDNRLLCKGGLPESNILYLTHYTHFSIPGERHLMGQLTRRLGINSSLPQRAAADWQVAIESEEIANSAPDTIIVSTALDSPLVDLILTHPVLQQTPAVRHKQVFSVDEAIQESPTQFLLMAYYDLAEILLSL